MRGVLSGSAVRSPPISVAFQLGQCKAQVIGSQLLSCSARQP